jgi:hypothetical protein
VRRHASAAAAGSTRRRIGWGSIDRRASTTHAPHHVDGSGAPARMRWRFAAISILGALLVFAPTAAFAATTHHPEAFSPLDGSGSGLQLLEATGMALDEGSGNVFVADGGPGHERIAILGREGEAPVGLAAPYELPGFNFPINSLAGLAFDNSPTSPAHGTLYVEDRETRTIRKFKRNATSERYESAGELAIPGETRGFALSVDGNGDLYVAEGSGFNGTVYEFDPLGFLLHEYQLFAGSNKALEGLAADDAGDLFVSTNVGLFKFPADPSGEIDPTTFTQLSEGFAFGVAFDSAIGHVFATESKRILEFDASSGEEIDEFGAGEIGQAGGIAVDSENERLYVADRSSLVGGHEDVDVFGPGVTVPTVTLGPASDITGTRATLNGSVTPEDLKVTECFFEWGRDLDGEPNYEHKSACEGQIGKDSATYPVSAAVAGLIANGTNYHFRLVAENGNGVEHTAGKTFKTGTTVTTEAATAVGPATANLNGVVRPEGVQYADCVFEYGLTTSLEFEAEEPCNPSAEEIGPDFIAHPVNLVLSGLKSNATYKYRLTATNANGALSGETLFFSTSGPPQIGDVQSSNAGQGALTLEARINPSGFGTSYRFEWGPTGAYGNVAPIEFEPFIGSGTEPILVKARISDLSAASTYHYRVSASSSRGTTRSTDQIAETLNSCGLPENRCFELVSRREAGPVAIPGEANAGIEMHYQAATGGPGGLAYPVESGYPEATKGAEVLYRALRGPNEWESTQLSTPIVAPNEQSTGSSVSDSTAWLADDLSCAFTESTQPLTPDPSMHLVIEEGGSNLYRTNPDGSYTPVTTLPPENAEGTQGLNNYAVADASQDCKVTVFESNYAYPGIDARAQPGGGHLYEWRDGTLRNAAIVPGPSGEMAVPAFAGSRPAPVVADTQNTVSDDGSRVFFSAERQTSSNPEEIGKKAIFVREDGRETRDLSLSETSVPDESATYQWATADGSAVFFTANAGLTSDSNSEGTDLYEYNLETDKLVDRSVTQAEGGAEVDGFVGAAADGSEVYFSSRNQLVPGAGASRAQNVNSGKYSLYGEGEGNLQFVGVFDERDRSHVLIEHQDEWNSQVSPDGRYLLFESSSHVTGYESNGLQEVYLHDTESQDTTCISCRQDGQPSPNERYGQPGYSLMPRGEPVLNLLHGPRYLTERDRQAQVFFSSPDPLGPGAVPGQNNIYEWSHDQIFRLGSASEGTQVAPFSGHYAVFAGASNDASDVYLITPETLTWEDGDERLSAYDARVGGGFPKPPMPPSACKSTTEGSCQETGREEAVFPEAVTETFSGPGNPNVQPKAKHKRKHKKKPKSRKRPKHKKKPKGKKEPTRHSNGNRRNGK